MSRTLCLLVWITAVTTAAAYNYNQPYGYFRTPYDYDTPVHQPSPRRDRMNARSAELPRQDFVKTSERSIADESEQQSTVEEEGRSVNRDQIRRFFNGTYKILNNFAKPFPVISQRRGETYEDKVVFPGPTSRNKIDVAIPPECRLTGICEKVNNYPKSLADKLIAELGASARFLTVDKLEIPEITQRVGPIQENIELCKSQEKISYPEGGEDSDGTWHTILNRQPNPVQGFRTEICETSVSSCRSLVRFDEGYSGKCVQKFVYRTMITIDESKGTTDHKEIKVPSCCSCVAYITN